MTIGGGKFQTIYTKKCLFQILFSDSKIILILINFQVWGIDEYLIGETQLGEYDYVHGCIKHDKDINFTLVHTDAIKKSYQRTVSYL